MPYAVPYGHYPTQPVGQMTSRVSTRLKPVSHFKELSIAPNVVNIPFQGYGVGPGRPPAVQQHHPYPPQAPTGMAPHQYQSWQGGPQHYPQPMPFHPVQAQPYPPQYAQAAPVIPQQQPHMSPPHPSMQQQQPTYGSPLRPTASSSLPPQEQAYYDALFGQAGGGASGVVSGKEAVQFMSRSGLPKPMLRQVRSRGCLLKTLCPLLATDASGRVYNTYCRQHHVLFILITVLLLLADKLSFLMALVCVLPACSACGHEIRSGRCVTPRALARWTAGSSARPCGSSPWARPGYSTCKTRPR